MEEGYYYEEEVSPPQYKNYKRFNHWLIMVLAGLVCLLAAGSVYLFFAKDRAVTNDGSIYQAVFLSNGQVYFGQIESQDDQYIELIDIYYLQLSGSLQGKSSNVESESDLSLVKLGSELHGPQDKMQINFEHVLFIEDMRGDSKVMRAIRDHKTAEPS